MAYCDSPWCFDPNCLKRSDFFVTWKRRIRSGRFVFRRYYLPL